MLLFTGCNTVPHIDRQAPPLVQARADLRYARRKSLPAAERAAFYLDAASLAETQLGRNQADPDARKFYNLSAAELTSLLRYDDYGQLWNRPLRLSACGAEYTLKFAPQTHKGIWSPDCFTDFVLADKISCGHIHQHITADGIGGTLVGIHKTPYDSPSKRPTFEVPYIGSVAPVTATLNFHGHTAALTLSDPSLVTTVRIHGKPQPLAADFTAPLAYHPPRNELWHGLMGLMHVEKYTSTAGLYMLHPYDPNRIPVILVHGLISTPRMWANVINEVEADPKLRGKFQFFVFAYPTGNAPAYSALMFRQALEKMQETYPMSHDFILVGHSMGGLVARMQVTTTGRALWDANFKDKADRYYARLPADHLVKQALIFNANPHVAEVVFICVPHRGSKMALGTLGAIGRSLITLPNAFVATLKQSILEVLQTVDGKIRMPNSIDGLSPKSPTLIAMDKLPISVPYYSIIGDRGRGDTPESTDGVVPYWSSHLEGVQSEWIVPGPHGAHELPQTIEDLKHILGLHLHKMAALGKCQN